MRTCIFLERSLMEKTIKELCKRAVATLCLLSGMSEADHSCRCLLFQGSTMNGEAVVLTWVYPVSISHLRISGRHGAWGHTQNRMGCFSELAAAWGLCERRSSTHISSWGFQVKILWKEESPYFQDSMIWGGHFIDLRGVDQAWKERIDQKVKDITYRTWSLIAGITHFLWRPTTSLFEYTCTSGHYLAQLN